MKIRIYGQCRECLIALEHEHPDWSQELKNLIVRMEYRNGQQVHVSGPGKRYHQKHTK